MTTPTIPQIDSVLCRAEDILDQAGIDCLKIRHVNDGHRKAIMIAQSDGEQAARLMDEDGLPVIIQAAGLDTATIKPL